MKNESDYQGWLEKLETPDIKGNFDQVHPAKLLFGFYQARKTGVLFVNDGVVKFYLYFSQGCLVPYKEGIFEEREFHRYLRSRGMITDEEFYAFAKQAREQQVNFVEYLLTKQVTTQSDVDKMAGVFYSKNVKGLFSWRHGGYCFYSTILPHLHEKGDQLQMLRTIVDGVREKYHPGMIEQRLEKRMRAPLKLYAKTPLPLEDLLVTEHEQKVHEWIRDGATLSHIITESELGATDARALIFVLLTINACKFATKAKKKAKVADKDDTVSTIPPNRLTRLFSMAEKNIDRLHKEFKNQPSEPTPLAWPAPANDEIPIELDNPEEELRRRLQEHIRHMKKQQGDVPPTDEKKLGKSVLCAKEMDELDMGGSLNENQTGDEPENLSDSEELRMMVDEETAESNLPDVDLSGKAKDELASPDEVDFIMDGESDLKLGEIDDEDKHLIGGTDKRDLNEGFLDDSSPILFSDDDPPEHIYQLGVSLIEQEYWGKAHEMIRTALDRGLENPLAKIHLGLAYYHDRADDSDRFHQASEWVQEGIAAMGKDPTGYLTLGKIYLEEGDKAMAELYFIKALEIDRDCVEAKEMIRKIYQER